MTQEALRDIVAALDAHRGEADVQTKGLVLLGVAGVPPPGLFFVCCCVCFSGEGVAGRECALVQRGRRQ